MVIRFEARRQADGTVRVRPLESALRTRAGRVLTPREIAHRAQMLEHLRSVAQNQVRDEHDHPDDDHHVGAYPA